MKDFRIDPESRGLVQLIRLGGSLDMYSFPRLEAQLNVFFQEGRYYVVLDCQDLDYIGSAGSREFPRPYPRHRGRSGPQSRV